MKKFKTPQEMNKFFADLMPVSIKEMKGDWKGQKIHSFGLCSTLLTDFILIKWLGKKFYGKNKANPVIIWFLGLKFNFPFCSAILKEEEYKKKFSVSMKYNYFPIIDYFRKIDDKTLMGIAEIKGKPKMYFYLKRD